MSTTCTDVNLDEVLGPSLTEEQARRIYRHGEEAVVMGFLFMASKLAALSPNKPSPTAPSGMVPGYQKPATRKRGKKPGAKPGHEGNHRATPTRIDDRCDHRLSCCPECQGRLKRCKATRTRLIEDIPAGITPIVTEHTIHRDWCPRCKKLVEPKVPDALPGATMGNRTAVMTAWMHYGLGNTISQIVDVFNYHLQMKLTRGGLVHLWGRLQEALFPWYEQIQVEALNSAVLHADETSWRVAGKTYWLWAFANQDLTYYLIDRSRGEPALLRFFTEEFHGTLVSDFWRLQRRGLCGPPRLLGPSASRPAQRGSLQERRSPVAGICKKTAATGRRCHPFGTAETRLAAGGLCLASATAGRTLGGVDYDPLGGQASEAIAANCRRRTEIGPFWRPVFIHLSGNQ